MSVNITIRSTKRNLEFIQVLETLRADGYDIKIRFMESNVCEFYIHHVSTRPIDLSQEENGYEVRITSLASKEDYELFAKTVKIVQNQTKGEVYYEDDNDEHIIDIGKYLSKEWIDEQMESDVRIISSLILSNVDRVEFPQGHEIGLYGPICMFYVGDSLFEQLGIKADTNWNEISGKLIERFRYSQYSRPLDIRRTTTSMAIDLSDESDAKEDAEKNKLTVYAKNAYDMISRADFIELLSEDGKSLLLKYEDFMKVVPARWERFDNSQYFTSPLSGQQFYLLWNRARNYSIDESADKMDYNEEDDAASGMRMAKAWFFTDVPYIREKIKQQGLPPCFMTKPSDNGEPPLFYAIAKCQEIIFGSDNYAAEYMPVVLEMRKKAKEVVYFWEEEIGIPKWESIPFNKFSDMFYVPDEDDTIVDVMNFEPKDFRDAGFCNSDLILYMGAQKLDFKRVQESIRAGVNPDQKFYPASEQDYLFCASEEMRIDAYCDFQHLYALYKWFLDTGEMVMDMTDFGKILSCAAHMKMYDFMKLEREKYLKRHSLK